MDKKDRLLALQYLLYEKIRSKIYEITGPDPEELLEYEFAFLKAVQKKGTPGCKNHFLQQLQHGTVLLCGDFHSLPSNQKCFLDLLKYQLDQGLEPPIIALESFTPADQEAIDKYLSDCLDESQFLEETQYFESWGFPWAGTKEILDFARVSGCPVVGINAVKVFGKPSSLTHRDIVFADNIVQALRSWPGKKLFALIGEHHLSRNHLPMQLLAHTSGVLDESSTTCLLTNTDKFYFQALKSIGHIQDAFLQIGERDFCLLDTPPWGKWLSYLLWQEHLISYPSCPHHLLPGDSRPEELCVFEAEEFFQDCFNGFLKFFGKDLAYPPVGDLYGRLISVDENYLLWASQGKHGFTYQKYKHFDSVLEVSSQTIFCRSLSWRGLINAVGQCLSQQLVAKKRERRTKRRLASESIKVSFVCHTLEAIFNPVGFMDQNWVEDNLLNREVASAQIALKVQSTDNSESNISLPELESYFILGRNLALILSINSAKKTEDYSYLHRFLLKNELPGPALVEKIIKSL